MSKKQIDHESLAKIPMGQIGKTAVISFAEYAAKFEEEEVKKLVESGIDEYTAQVFLSVTHAGAILACIQAMSDQLTPQAVNLIRATAEHLYKLVSSAVAANQAPSQPPVTEISPVLSDEQLEELNKLFRGKIGNA